MTPLERLEAVEEIKKLKARYFRSVDTKDWDGLRQVFAPDARIDLTLAQTPTDRSGGIVALDGVAPPPPNPASMLDREGMVDIARRTLSEAVSVHHGHMPEIEVTGAGVAQGIWPMEDMIRWPEGYPVRRLHAFGHYHETYVQLPEGWRIKTMKLTRLRIDSDPPGGAVGGRPAA